MYSELHQGLIQHTVADMLSFCAQQRQSLNVSTEINNDTASTLKQFLDCSYSFKIQNKEAQLFDFFLFLGSSPKYLTLVEETSSTFALSKHSILLKTMVNLMDHFILHVVQYYKSVKFETFYFISIRDSDLRSTPLCDNTSEIIAE